MTNLLKRQSFLLLAVFLLLPLFALAEGGENAWRTEYNQAKQFIKDQNYESAEEKLKSALDKAEDDKQVDPGMITCMLSLSKVYDKTGRPEESERLYQFALRTMEGHKSVMSNDFADLLPGLADLYYSHGNKEADQIHRRLIQIREKILDKDSPKLAEAYESYAKYLENTGQPERATAFKQKAHTIKYKNENGSPIQ